MCHTLSGSNDKFYLIVESIIITQPQQHNRPDSMKCLQSNVNGIFSIRFRYCFV
jgi:hypothetical protein